MKRTFRVLFAVIFMSVALAGCQTPPKKEEIKVVAPPPTEPVETFESEPVEEILMETVEIVLSDVYFEYNRFSLTSDTKSVLKANAEELKRDPNSKITIAGHCDERGTNEYNISLGDKRANEVKRYLKGLGIDSSRVRAISYGEEKPVCYESNESCWQKNRRAEFTIE